MRPLCLCMCRSSSFWLPITSSEEYDRTCYVVGGTFINSIIAYYLYSLRSHARANKILCHCSCIRIWLKAKDYSIWLHHHEEEESVSRKGYIIERGRKCIAQ